MDFLTFVLSVYIFVMVFSFLIFRKKEKNKPSNDYETLMNILNSIIEREIKYKHELDYKIKDIRVIYNFEEDLKQLTLNIISGISKELMNELLYYHPKEYIFKYIARVVEYYLIEYTRKNKVKTK